MPRMGISTSFASRLVARITTALLYVFVLYCYATLRTHSPYRMLSMDAIGVHLSNPQSYPHPKLLTSSACVVKIFGISHNAETYTNHSTSIVGQDKTIDPNFRQVANIEIYSKSPSLDAFSHFRSFISIGCSIPGNADPEGDSNFPW